LGESGFVPLATEWHLAPGTSDDRQHETVPREVARALAHSLPHAQVATAAQRKQGTNTIMGKPERAFGFNVIGPISANAGVAILARSVVRILVQRGYPVALLDVDPGLGRGGHDLTYESLMVKSQDELPYAVNLSVLSITALPDFVIQRPALMRGDTLNVGCFVWELAALPRVWKEALEFFDVLVAKSDFIRSTFENTLPQVPTISSIYPLALPRDVQANRARFDIPNDAVVFVCIVDPTSDPERKNPFAAIEAFRNALGDDEQAWLVVKVNNATHNGNAHALVPKIRAHCRSHARILLIEEGLSYPEVLSLYASCDVFVALHRSEGLGLGPLEAMALGKPVIATGWSGNMTYMDHHNACLVRYKLIPVAGSLPVYTRQFLGTDALWADPDLEHAAAWMKRLANDPDLRSRIGRRAEESVAEFMRKGEEAKFATELYAIWQSRDYLPARPALSDQDVARLREIAFEHSASVTQVMANKARRVLDRHFIWRFRRFMAPRDL
jgi:glycosyltransferase involved in cell wall biosynthesis